MAPEVQQAGIAATLGLNYKLFLAQLINFGVVLFVIWRWVYKPLVKILDERSKKIEQGLKDADASKLMRETAEEEKTKMVTAARLKAKEIIETAETETKKRREQIIAEAKSEVEQVVTEGKQRLRDEQTAMIDEARQKVAEVVVAATERVLQEKMNDKKDAELIKSALEGLK
ncbi:F0F1 ATP synthase subunit B [Patescibacteria group bacterium]|nr:F0F1 ATP synthase subunit B [Patescibacteria group bacterium]